MSERLSFGLSIDPSAAAADVAFRLADLADTAGYDLVGIQDHPYQPGFFDTWTLLTALAMRTRRVSFTPDVSSLALRPPAMLFKAASSLQILSGGRVILGVGSGFSGSAISSYGGPRLASVGETVSAFEEALIIFKRLQAARAPVTFDGVYHWLEGAQAGPVPSKPLPIWIGANKPRVLKLTGTYGDGWLSPGNVYVPPQEVLERQRIIDEAARAANREPRAIRRIYNVMGYITPSGGGQEEPGRPLIGPASYWVDRLGYYATALGFDSFIFWPLQQPEEQARLFAAQVIPELQAISTH